VKKKAIASYSARKKKAIAPYCEEKSDRPLL
jgi:hypothetical protein